MDQKEISRLVLIYTEGLPESHLGVLTTPEVTQVSQIVEGWMKVKMSVRPGLPEETWVASPFSRSGEYRSIKKEGKEEKINKGGLHSAVQFSRGQVISLFERTETMKYRLGKKIIGNELEGQTVSIVFCENGGPTIESFSRAAQWLGCRHLVVCEAEQASLLGGANLRSRERLRLLTGQISNSQVIVVNHPDPECTQVVSGFLDERRVPVIRGWSTSENPTHAIQDLYTINWKFGKMDGLKLAVIGSGCCPEAVSLILLMTSVTKNPEVMVISSSLAVLAFDYTKFVQRGGIKYREERDISEALDWADVLYLTDDPKKLGGGYEFLPQQLSRRDAPLILMPLDEEGLTTADPQSISHLQRENGMFTKMALLSMMMEKD